MKQGNGKSIYCCSHQNLISRIVHLRDTLLYTLRCTSFTGGAKITEPTKKLLLNCLWGYVGAGEFKQQKLISHMCPFEMNCDKH